MAFNHYAKIKRILTAQPDGWVIKRINQPTTSTNFQGQTLHYDHYYRIYDHNDHPVKYCKFQQIDRLASVLNRSVESLPVIE